MANSILDKPTFALLLFCCPRLYGRALHISGTSGQRGLALFALEVMAGTGYHRALRLLLFGFRSPIVYHAIFLWPGIRFLTVGARITTLSPFKLPAIKLYELALQYFDTISCLDWLLSSSEDSLQILELRDVPGRQIKDILIKTRHNLGSLRLERYFKTFAHKLRSCGGADYIPVSSTVAEHFTLHNLTMYFTCKIYEW